MDFLDRKSAPLSDQDWGKLDEAVVTAARNILVGRRMMSILGPLGAGTMTVPHSIFAGRPQSGMDMTGASEEFVVEAQSRTSVNLPVLYQDFKLNWRDVETDRQLGFPFDTSTAATAATLLAVQEDNLIFNGSETLGLDGLLTAKNRQTVALGNWDEPGMALSDTVQAVGALNAAGHPGPFAMSVSPKLYGRMVRAFANTGMLELDQVKALLRGPVFPSSAITGNKGVVLATGSQNVQLAVGQDMVVGYLGPTAMNHLFRVMETVTVVIRRGDAICTIE